MNLNTGHSVQAGRIAAWFAAAWIGLALTASAARPMALVIMLDGCRADAVENATAPNLQKLMAGQWQPGYRCASSLTAHTIPDGPTHSAPNHAAIATGVTSAKTNVRSNREFGNCDYSKWPSWLVRLVDAQPDKKALFVYSWRTDEQLSPSEKVEFLHGGDVANGGELAKRLASPDAPDATLFFIDLPDHGGHGAGYYPYTTEYLRTVRISDAIVGKCLAAIASRPTFAEEDWLIIVTADHGGYLKTHAATNGQTRTIPFMVCSRHVAQGQIPGCPRNYDAAPTALAHFGIDISKMELDGRVVGGEAPVAEKPRALKEGLVAYYPFDAGAPQRFAIAEGIVAEANGVALSGTPGGFTGCFLSLRPTTNEAAFVRLKGSERLAFENGADFTAAMWVRMDEPQKGDPVIFGNKNWKSGLNHGIALNGAFTTSGFAKRGVCFNCGVSDGRARLDETLYEIDYGRWEFYAVTRSADGVLTVYQGSACGRFYWIADEAKALKLTTGMSFCIGQDGTGRYGSTFAGGVDDFALWTRALTRDEVRRIYEAGRQGTSLGDLIR